MKMLFYLFLLLLSAPSVPGRSVQARQAAARSDMSSLQTALDAFKVDCGRFPYTEEGWEALVHCPTNSLAGRWHGSYLNTIPIDPWGKPYVYTSPGRHNTNGFDLYSCGADGLSKTHGSDLDDINNWDPSSPHGGNYFEEQRPLPVYGLFGFNLVLFALMVWNNSRNQAPKVERLFYRRQWEGMVAVLWFALGLGVAIGWPVPSHSPGEMFMFTALIALCFWWVFGLVLAISGLRSRSEIGVLSGLVALLEFLFAIWWVITPKMQ